MQKRTRGYNKRQATFCLAQLLLVIKNETAICGYTAWRYFIGVF
jgi:hypothetical protein